MYNGSSSDREGSITEKDNLVTDDVNGENINSKFWYPIDDQKRAIGF